MTIRLLAAAALLALVACGAPLRDVPRLDEVDIADAPGTAGMRADPAETADTPIADAAPAPRTDAAPARRGLFAALFGAKSDTAPATGGGGRPDGAETATAPPDAAAGRSAPERGGGLLGALFGRDGGGAALGDGVEYASAGPNAQLAYGTLGRVCGVPQRRLGTPIARHPDDGGGYVLHDSDPASTGARSFFVTGFSDGCARQFTAALAMFGSPETYEMIRFGAASGTQPLAETDAAYDRVKSKVCRVARTKPCGDRIGRLARDTAFLSIYERFGSNPSWKTLLLHDGAVVALDTKTR